jgi:hypothetical protein
MLPSALAVCPCPWKKGIGDFAIEEVQKRKKGGEMDATSRR